MYLGDYAGNSIVYFTWSSNDADGASITRSTDGTVRVYKDDGDAESTAGVTDTEDFDGLTGVHMCKIDTSADAFYATGHHYSVVLAGATIDAQTVNAPLACFSIENRFDSDLAIAAALAAHDAKLDTVDSLVDAIKVLTDKLATMVELDGAVYRYTDNALEEAPGGTSIVTQGPRIGD